MASFVLLISIFMPIIMTFIMRQFPLKKNIKKIGYLLIAIFTTIFNFIVLFLIDDKEFVLIKISQSMKIGFMLDGLGKIFFTLVSFLWPFAMLYAIAYMEHDDFWEDYIMFYLMTYGVVVGISCSSNLFTMFIFYELLTLITLPLITHDNTIESRKAGRVYLYISLAGSALAFMGLCYILTKTGSSNFVYGGLEGLNKGYGVELAYISMFFGFGVKAAIFPLHFWLPKAGAAPTPTTALLHAVAVVKAGAFAIARCTYYLIDIDLLRNTRAQYVALVFSAFTILFGSIMALRETHFKRRLAYSTISNISYIVFSLSTMNNIGLIAAMLHFVIHSISKICLFYCCGIFMHKANVTYVEDCNGLYKEFKTEFICFTISGLSLIGIPLFGGFISKWYIAKAAIESMNTLGYIGVGCLIISALLTAIYILTISFRIVLFDKKVTKEIKKNGKWNFGYTIPIIVMSILSILLGIFSEPFINIMSNLLGGGII